MPPSSVALPQSSGRTLAFIYFTIFLDLMGSTLLLPIAPYIARQYSTSALTVGLLTIIYAVGAFLATPALGKLSDRYGRRPVLLGSLLGSAASCFLFGVGGALWVLFLARLIDGLTGGNIATAMAYIADITPPKERTRSFAFMGVAFGMGFTLGPVFAGVLSGVSLYAPIWAAGGLSLASFLFGLFFLPESLAPALRSTEPIRLAALNPLAVMREITRLPSLRGLLPAVLLINLAYNGMFIYMAVYTAGSFAASAQDNALLFTLVGAFQMIGQGTLVYRLTARFGEKRVALAGLLIQAVLYLLFVAVPRFAALYPLVILGAMGNALARPTIDALVANHATPAEQGRAAGVSNALYSLSSVLGPLLAGLAYDHLSPTALFMGGGALLAAAAFLISQIRDQSTLSGGRTR